MLSPEVIKKIKKIHFKSSRRVNTLMAGQYRSVFRGSGIEFEEVREYSPGDDVKSIDWKVSARLGRPYIKRYREERELVVNLLVDMSASGGFGTGDMLKREAAAETAAILAFNAVRNNDKVGAILFTDRIERHIPPQKGSAHVWRLIKEIFAFQPERTGTDIREALAFLGRVARKRSVAFLISDFQDDGYSREMRMLSRKHELIGVVLSDPGEFRLPEGGLLTLRDPETGEAQLIDASDAATRKAYEAARAEDYRRRLGALKAADVDAVELQTGDQAADALTRYFRYRERRRR
ncbi:DUF58 domain-containing protein [Desulfococcus sp.]|uniref:DUF58 domain-containing protein n=1 Tax=Desulfococcus sp. TaxID=2025834 RepID=UPI0035933DCB